MSILVSVATFLTHKNHVCVLLLSLPNIKTNLWPSAQPHWHPHRSPKRGLSEDKQWPSGRIVRSNSPASGNRPHSRFDGLCIFFGHFSLVGQLYSNHCLAEIPTLAFYPILSHLCWHETLYVVRTFGTQGAIFNLETTIPTTTTIQLSCWQIWKYCTHSII